MIADLGYASVFIAFCAALFAVGASWYGARTDQMRWIEAARNAVVSIFPLTLLACLLLIYLMLTNDFSVQYVIQVTSRDTPTYLKVTALWGSQAGSLLFWNLMLSVFTAGAMLGKWYEERELMPYSILTAALSLAFFLFISGFIENPFLRAAVVPADGMGLNPLLRHPGMIIHPPMLYLGFVGFTVPYSFAMAALISGRLDDSWIRTTRRWTLIAWLFLSLGLILGGRWAYDVLGWGGYWGWDPVENASLMPWLAGTAFLHSVMIQEKRDMFRLWNMFLIILTYLLVISGTFIVRSGLVSSVHTFAQSSIGWYFFGFIAFMFTFSTYWVVRRRQALATPNRLESIFSRESAFLFNNFLILAMLAATALGVYFPVLSDLFTGQKITVGPPYYERVNGPLGAALVVLMGVAPLTMWHRTNLQKLGRQVRWPALAAVVFVVVLIALGIRNWLALLGLWGAFFSAVLTLAEFVKGARARMKRGEGALFAFQRMFAQNRRRYGGYLIHMGVLVMAFGIIGVEFFQQETQVRLHSGESVSLGRYTVWFNSVERFMGQDDLLITQGSLDLYAGDRLVKTLRPQIEMYTRTGQPMTIPDLRSTVMEDLYVIMVNWEGVAADAATFKVYLNPLINWVWAGAVIFILGTMVAAWPDLVESRVLAAARARRLATSGD